MTMMSRVQQVLELQQDIIYEDEKDGPMVGFIDTEYNVHPDDRSQMMHVQIPWDTWKELGSPGLMTVSVVPGNALNE